MHGVDGPFLEMVILKDGNYHEKNQASIGKWASLFGMKPTGKLYFLYINVISNPTKGDFSIIVANSVIDHSGLSMDLTLIGKILGSWPNIDVVRLYAQNKWILKGQGDIATMPKGFFSFEFSNGEYMSNILCGGPWMVVKSYLALQKWSPNLDYNDSSFFFFSYLGSAP